MQRDITRLMEHFDPYDRELFGNTGEELYATYKSMRDRCPVTHSDQYGGFYVLTSYDAVYAALHDPSTFSSKEVTIPPMPKEGPWIPIELDPPLHGKYKSIVLPLLSPQRCRDFVPIARTAATKLIDAFASDTEVDLAKAFSIPFPGIVLCQLLLAVPLEDRAWFQEKADALVHAVDDPTARLGAVNDLTEYVGRLLAERRNSGDLGRDLLSVMMQAEVDGKVLSDDELTSFAVFLLFAGHETTSSGIGNGLLHMARHPDLRDRLVADPSLIPAAVEEFLRWESPVAISRVVVRDVTLEGVELHEGDRVWVAMAAADMDEHEFPNADTVDFDRKPNRHLAFGGGIHRCLGAHLARMEMRVAFEEILRRIPKFSLKDESAVIRSVGLSRGVVSLPVVLS